MTQQDMNEKLISEEKY